MRKLLGIVVIALLGAGSPAGASLVTGSDAAPEASAPKVAPALQRVLDAGTSEPLVVFVHGRDLGAARAAVTAAGLTRVNEWTSIDVVVARGTAAKVAAVVGQPGVTYVEPDTPITFNLDTARAATRTDEAQARSWPLGDGTRGGPFDGAGRSIAIVDSGVDGTHPMFQRADGTSKVVRNLKLACGEESLGLCPADPSGQDLQWIDLTSTTNDSDTPSAGGHGTHVASIAGGGHVDALGRDLAGTAPGASIVALSVGTGISIYGPDTALDWIVRHHDAPCGDDVDEAACPPITVVNNSYGPPGGGEFDPQSATTKLQRALVAEGVTVVWANGNGDVLNDGGDGSDNRSNPPGQDPTPGVISVANYDDASSGTRDGGLSSTSSRGEKGRVGTYPDLSAPGTNITAACRPYLAICTSFEGDPNYGTITGTSMAAPHVAGIVATLQQAMEAAGRNPRPAAIENILEDSAHKYGFGGEYEADPTNTNDTTSFDKGHGLADTYNALRLIFRLMPQEPKGGDGCRADATGFTDPEGDASRVALPEFEAAYDPRVDLVDVTVTGDPSAEKMSFTFGMAEVDGSDPSGSPGMSVELTFAVAGAAHEVNVFRSNSEGIEFGDLDGDDTGVQLVVDEDADTLRVIIPRARFGPDAHGEVTLSGFHSFTRRNTGVILAPVSDEAGGPCPVTVNVGGA